MLSRVAEAIHWMNRYVERAENVARFVDVSLHLSLDLPQPDAAQWDALVVASGDEPLFRTLYGESTQDNVIRFLTFDRSSPNSILSCLHHARENARSVRETISSEAWEQVNRAYLLVNEAASTGVAMESPHAFFTAVKQASHLFVGIVYLTMTHNEGWHFGRLGRLIERADKTSRIVEVKSYLLGTEGGERSERGERGELGAPTDEIQWAALLKSASAFEMYRKRFGMIVPRDVVAFLLFDRQFPRSMRYCLRKAERSLHAITGTPLGTHENEAERKLGRLHAELEFGDVNEVLARGLRPYLDGFQGTLNDVGSSIYETFFALRPDEESPASMRFDA